ncbi:MAG TPA: nucleotide sugar dehydrogenase [Phycisphaerae bacterium]|nr:nucleotide sugar dehydrogenase [Phycisphaerae bacterium]HOJ55110.1 nucleotide sugar dehydrogenase [Phycisphaerae bacterium]HOL27924.1 nucleotide sugar dehydrogenase [Phycisphaerae bacterium]HPP21733.1 nucleotide sugar dehydrogenase [Phycisphaerae bacterium]HPU31554.1 nucleotide sugar dehydrogenase [Phycisphaerae bacterium]
MSDNHLLDKIQSGAARVVVMGMGYVGMPLARSFARGGLSVIGYDVDKEKVKKLNAGQSYIQHIPSSFIAEMRAKGRFVATSNPADLKKGDAIIICVPTPLSKTRDPDMTYVIKTAETIAGQIRRDQLVVLESTTYPGTTREVVKPIIERSGLKAGKDFFLAFSPEREDPGRKDFTTETIPKVVGGLEPRSMRLAVALYSKAIKAVVPVSSCEVAEAAKIVENVYRCVNIAMVNELKMVFERMGIDVWEVINAAKTKPFGFQAFYPGPGLGGHCIPIDPFYLTWKAREYGMPTRFIELAGEINTSMPEYVVEHVSAALNEHKKALKGAKVLVLGLAYKKDVDDIRESPSIELIELLKAKGAKVDYNDPHVPSTHKQREHDLRMKSVPLTPASLKKYDCVLISTDHSCYDYAMIVKNAKLVVDTRNATAQVKGPKKNVVKA